MCQEEDIDKKIGEVFQLSYLHSEKTLFFKIKKKIKLKLNFYFFIIYFIFLWLTFIFVCVFGV